MDRISAILNILGLALLVIVITVKLQPVIVITVLTIAGICIIAAAIRTFINIFRNMRK